MVPGIRVILVDEGVIPKLIQLSLEEKICVYRKLNRRDVEIGDLIAKGAGGVVYKGRWDEKYVSLSLSFSVSFFLPFVCRDVAVKICGKMGMFYGSKLEFLFEVAVMSLLEHSNILSCYGANESGEEPFIVLPYCGKSFF